MLADAAGRRGSGFVHEGLTSRSVHAQQGPTGNVKGYCGFQSTATEVLQGTYPERRMVRVNDLSIWGNRQAELVENLGQILESW